MDVAPEIDIRCEVLRQEDLRVRDPGSIQKVLLRCRDVAGGSLTVENLPSAKIVLLETEKPAELIVRDLPALRRVLLKRVGRFDAALEQPLDFLEFRGLRKEHVVPPLAIVSTRDLSFQEWYVPSCDLQDPELINRLSFHNIRQELEVSRWMRECTDLETLHIFNCHGFIPSGIEAFQNLKKLWLVDVGAPLKSVDFLTSLPSLEEVNLGGETNIASGDLRPLLALPKLRRVLFANRGHYNMRMKRYDMDVVSLIAR